MTQTVESTKVRERPILFSGEMVRAILDGRKSQTRRVMRTQPEHGSAITDKRDGFGFLVEKWPRQLTEYANFGRCERVHCPYGGPGDRLWVRETFAAPKNGMHIVAYQADGECGSWMGDGNGGQFWNRHGGVVDRRVPVRSEAWRGESYSLAAYGGKWKPSIHMPRWASRLTLEVTEVRVERVQDISEADCWAEGIERSTESPTQASTIYSDYAHPRRAFCLLWDSINAKRGYSWDSSPWVWVLSFNRVDSRPSALGSET